MTKTTHFGFDDEGKLIFKYIKITILIWLEKMKKSSQGEFKPGWIQAKVDSSQGGVAFGNNSKLATAPNINFLLYEYVVITKEFF